jgi:hypothetical protein
VLNSEYVKSLSYIENKTISNTQKHSRIFFISVSFMQNKVLFQDLAIKCENISPVYEYRLMALKKGETIIIARIEASPIGEVVIIMVAYV